MEAEKSIAIIRGQEENKNITDLADVQTKKVKQLLEMAKLKSQLVKSVRQSKKDWQINTILWKVLLFSILNEDWTYINDWDSELFIELVVVAINGSEWNDEQKNREFFDIFEKYIFNIKDWVIWNKKLFFHYFKTLNNEKKVLYFEIYIKLNQFNNLEDEDLYSMLIELDSKYLIEAFLNKDGLLYKYREKHLDLIISNFLVCRKLISNELTSEVFNLANKIDLNWILKDSYWYSCKQSSTWWNNKTFFQLFIEDFEWEIDLLIIIEALDWEINHSDLMLLLKRFENLWEELDKIWFFDDVNYILSFLKSWWEDYLPKKHKLWDYEVQLLLIKWIWEKMQQIILENYPDVSGLLNAVENNDTSIISAQILSKLADSKFLYFDLNNC
jgi:hypothetical protein